MHRFFISFTPTESSVILYDQAQQIAQVLRMRAGEHILLLDNTGWEYEVVLQQVGKQKVCGEVVGRRVAMGEPETHITLYQSVFKWERFEWMLQKCTEVGVSRFVPMITQRSFVQKTADFSPNRYLRCQRIIQEAAEQCGRSRLPVLETAVSFSHALSHLPPFDLCLMPHEQTQDKTIPLVLKTQNPKLKTQNSKLKTQNSKLKTQNSKLETQNSKLETQNSKLKTQNSKLETIALFIGPEGGFTEEEVANGRSHGLLPVTLGKRILRAETAAMVAATILIHQLEEVVW